MARPRKAVSGVSHHRQCAKESSRRLAIVVIRSASLFEEALQHLSVRCQAQREALLHEQHLKLGDRWSLATA